MFKCKQITELRIGSRKAKEKTKKGKEHEIIVHSLIIKVIDENDNEKVTGVDVGIGTLASISMCIGRFLRDKKEISIRPDAKDNAIDFFSLSYLLLPITGEDAECAMMSIGKSNVYGRITIKALTKFYDNIKGLVPHIPANEELVKKMKESIKEDNKVVQFDKNRRIGRGMTNGGFI